MAEREIETLFTGLTRLGEAPIYNQDTGDLTFVDCFGPPNPVLYRYNTATKALDHHDLAGVNFCSSANPTTKKDTFLLTCDRDLVQLTWDGNANETKVLSSVEQDAKIKMGINDAKADRNGRLWFGTLNTEWVEEELNVANKGTGSFYSADFSQGAVVRKHTSVSPLDVSNGIDWTADNRTMFVADTGRRVIYAYDYDAQTGEISNERVAVDFRKVKIRIYMGAPDGLAVDSNDKIWVACYGAAWISCFDPSTGALLDRIHMPCNGVTSCVFGGPHMNQLFVTSATQKWENGGNLYRVDGFQSKGLPQHRVLLN